MITIEGGEIVKAEKDPHTELVSCNIRYLDGTMHRAFLTQAEYDLRLFKQTLILKYGYKQELLEKLLEYQRDVDYERFKQRKE